LAQAWLQSLYLQRHAMVPPAMSLLSALVAVLFLPGLAKDLPWNSSSPVHRGGDQGVTAVTQGLNASSPVHRGADQGVTALPSRLNNSSPVHHQGGKGVITLGSCSADDNTKMWDMGPGNADGTFPKLLHTCARRALRAGLWWSRRHSPQSFTTCITNEARLSQPCAQCFVTAAQYGWDNCKWKCFWRSWCGTRCLNCVSPANAPVQTCAGVTVPTATSC